MGRNTDFVSMMRIGGRKDDGSDGIKCIQLFGDVKSEENQE